MNRFTQAVRRAKIAAEHLKIHNCEDHFVCQNIPASENTAGVFWELPAGASIFNVVAPLRPFLKMQLILRAAQACEVVVLAVDAAQDNFCSVTVKLLPGELKSVDFPAVPGAANYTFASDGPFKILGILGVTVGTAYTSYILSSRGDLLTHTSSGCEHKFTLAGLQLASVSGLSAPWSAQITAKNAFSEETIYAEHISATAAMEIQRSGGQEKYICKGTLIFTSAGTGAAKGFHIHAKHGGKCVYKAEALVPTEYSLNVTRIKDSAGVENVGSFI